MTGTLFFLSNAAAGGVRAAAGLFLVFRLLADRKPGRGRVTAAFAGGAMISLLLSAPGAPEFYYLLLETVWLALCASRFQGTEARMSLFVGIFYEIAVFFWKFLTAAWAGVCFHSPAFLDSGAGSGQAALWLLHLLLCALVWYLWRRPGLNGTEAFRLASGVALTGFLAVVTLSQQTALPLADDTLDMWTILSVVLMMSVLVFNMNCQYQVERELARLKAQQARLLERDYTALNNAYAVNARLFHDLHNHIGALRQLLSCQKIPEALEYLDQLQAPVQEMTHTVWTGDETVDYLINSKAQAAAATDIRFEAQAEFPRHTNLKSADLCAILGNLLDNALEAAEKTPEDGERFVRLTIRRINQMVVIKVENSFRVLPIEREGALQTSKEDNGLHGWGLKSAQTAAGKYDGTVQTSYEDSVFRAVATLSFQGVSIEQADESHKKM